MKAKMFRALLPIAIVFTLISCSSDSSEDTAPIVEEFSYSDTEIDLMNKINNHRASQGLNELQPINHVSFKSAEHNDYMIKNDVVGHQYLSKEPIISNKFWVRFK
jgi:uncharacterized protein YkwD